MTVLPSYRPPPSSRRFAQRSLWPARLSRLARSQPVPWPQRVAWIPRRGDHDNARPAPHQEQPFKQRGPMAEEEVIPAAFDYFGNDHRHGAAGMFIGELAQTIQEWAVKLAVS